MFFSALALHFLHINKIAHMDLKPQNLLLSARENPILKLAGMNITLSGGWRGQGGLIFLLPVHLSPGFPPLSVVVPVCVCF